MATISAKSVGTLRIVVQWCFLLWVVGMGIRFGMFVNAIQSGAAAPLDSRQWSVLVFMAGIGAGMVSGHWRSSLSYDDYQRLILLVPYLSH